jgi:hypothetical protein
VIIEEIILAGGIFYIGGRPRESLELSETLYAYRLGPLGAFAWFTHEQCCLLNALTVWRPIEGEGEFFSDRSM